MRLGVRACWRQRERRVLDIMRRRTGYWCQMGPPPSLDEGREKTTRASRAGTQFREMLWGSNGTSSASVLVDQAPCCSSVFRGLELR